MNDFDFDKKVKKELQNHLKKSIQLQSKDRERIHSNIQTKKRSPFLYYAAITMTVFIAIILIFPIWQGSDTTWNITLSDFSNRQLKMKDMLEEKAEGSKLEEEQVDVRKNDQEDEKNESVEKDQSKDSNEESVDKTDESEESRVEEAAEEQEEVAEEMELTEAEAWELIDKFNSMTPTLISLSDTEYLHPEAIGHELIGFETHDQVYELFTDFIIKDVTKYLYEHSISAYENKVYLIPMDGHFSFIRGTEIQITKIENEKYKVRQDVLDETTFNYFVEIMVAKIDGVWKIAGYASETY